MDTVRNVIKFLNIYYWPLLVLILITCFYVSISPFVKLGDGGYFYYTIKPYLLQFFGSKGNMWVFLAFFTIPLQEFYKLIQQKEKIFENLESAKVGLLDELERNMDSIFSDNVDKPISTYWYEQIDKSLLPHLGKNSISKWKKFCDLYIDIIYYKNLVSTYFISKQIDVAEYQFIAQNRYASFLDWKTGLEELENEQPRYKKIGKQTLTEFYPKKKSYLYKKVQSKVSQLFTN